jgi:hypothetical protein
MAAITHIEIVGPYIAAMMMSLGALCAFIWGVFSGAFRNVDDAALRFFHTEVGSDVRTTEERSGKPGTSRTRGA